MEAGLFSFHKISIDFQESHLFFPTIISWVVAILAGIIFLVYGIRFIRDVASGSRKPRFFVENYDKFRLYGTVILTVVYFIAMDLVGRYFPNTGFGFLFMSIPFMFVLSLMYSHEFNRSKMIVIAVNSIIAPSVSWYILGKLFNITLP